MCVSACLSCFSLLSNASPPPPSASISVVTNLTHLSLLSLCNNNQQHKHDNRWMWELYQWYRQRRPLLPTSYPIIWWCPLGKPSLSFSLSLPLVAYIPLSVDRTCFVCVSHFVQVARPVYASLATYTPTLEHTASTHPHTHHTPSLLPTHKKPTTGCWFPIQQRHYRSLRSQACPDQRSWYDILLAWLGLDCLLREVLQPQAGR